MVVVNSLTHTLKLPAPLSKTNIPMQCLKQPLMMLRPKIKFCTHAGKCMCIIVGQKDSHHREAVLPDSCLRRGILYQLTFSMEPVTKAPFYENPSRFYYFNTKEADFTLCVPQPFRNGASWKPKQFQPFMSDCADEKATALYYGLYNPQKARDVAAIYQRPPSDWIKSTHPCLGEPKEGSEL